MVSFENFVKSMLPSSSELKVTPSFFFHFKIPDDPTATTGHQPIKTGKLAKMGLNLFKFLSYFLLSTENTTRFFSGDLTKVSVNTNQQESKSCKLGLSGRK